MCYRCTLAETKFRLLMINILTSNLKRKRKNSCFHAGKTFFGSRNHAGAGHWLLPVWNPSTLHFGWERRRGSGPLATPRVESHPEVTEAAARATRCLSVSLSLCRSVSLSPCLPVSPSLCLSVFPCYTSTFVMLQRHMRR